MIKKLCPVGNSLGLVIEKPLLDILGIQKNTPLDISTDGIRLIIKPIPESIVRSEKQKRSANRLKANMNREVNR